MTDDHRSAPRQRVLKGGRIVINDGFSTFQCTVRNLSATGARLKVAGIIGIPDSFDLVMDDGRKFACTVAWKTEFEIGVHFA
ncbi:PilZ domain-containing protein [Devosia oryziradicis]|uniref:PilZ domain-containing protein n=1 Tax=Devosia oryziradicis TaxID=2801335 RepID=A0ABX7BV95_9HYPH|nr:PilZ domain-containing protein [Devosia oryziradicis]QQR35838.1 PilZ domain-containing protein [Devosia oryziradicis]